MADDDSSELSSLSELSSAPSESDEEIEVKREKGILKFFHKLPAGTKPAEPKKEASPPPRKRSPSPAHEYVLADNPDVAFIVMFRARFNDALPKSLANFGPQEIERDVTESIPGERVEHFLCAVLSLLLNRKQDVKPGHYNRALEDAIHTHKNQWARDWEDQSPLSGGKTFTTMDPTERLKLLRTLIVWTLSSSEVIKGIINKSYKGGRHEDDLNQPLSVQPWGSDSDKRRYYLIEGLDDTHFRVYRESNPQGFNRTWWSVAGDIDELKALAEKLQTSDGGPKAKKLAHKMLAAVPRFEATEEKRKRREYRLMRKEQFKRPEPGFSMYEGRTRGKRMKYTYSDDEDFLSDSTGFRRSSRNTRNPTPAEQQQQPAGPVVTASGRQVKAPSRMTVDASSNIVTVSPTTSRGPNEAAESKESSVGPSGRPRRSAAVNHGTNGWAPSSKKGRGYNSMDDDMEEYDSQEEDSEPELGDDEEDAHEPENDSEEEDEYDEDEKMVDDDLDDANSKGSMMVKLKLPSKKRDSSDANGSAFNLDDYRYNGKKDDSKSKSSSTAESSGAQKEPTPEEKSEEVISVATTRKQTTPEKPAAPANNDQPSRRPTTPALNALQSTSLAFRESPDKVQQALPKHVDVGAGE
ncbi:uncharacterized protein F4807DRAFT_311647 [Annulohypoxylon truncatum]|uniref:uncharacterized protein n=1 Tax=Annulohypoxylon truncatum TaxID=327061 RepID=UPI0020077F16|nr:uncharacterized protein F4807DRAFT_311647 [Annulohypoxylon truncatum]KAI1213108.1 hypothetical protein F4807DRAFT_311647 [Annulohypoxylon truncatum]